MAKRRCIGVDVYSSWEFLSLSHSAKALYAYLVLYSDDEGVVINPRSVLHMCSMGEEELAELIKNGFVIEVEGVYIIRHWYAQNKIQPSKMTASMYQYELGALCINERKEYEYLQGKN